MQKNRQNFTDNEKQLLLNEVQGRCPICNNRLTTQKNGKICKTFEIAHIYPANPRPEEATLLINEERLSDNVNALENLIAVCRTCHKIFDTPRTIQEYHKWVSLKKKLIQDNTLKDSYELFNIETDIKVVMEKLNSASIEEELVPLSFNSLKVEEKANSSLSNILKRSIKNNIVDYFTYIQQNFINLDKETPYKFSTIAAQIKGFYCKCMQINDNQEDVYNTLVDWLDEKTGHYSKEACKVLIAFFIQDCEVFS